MSKTFTAIIIVSAILQIVFSFFYSSSIIIQNNQLDENITELNQLKIETEIIEKEVADLSSIKKINQSTPSAALQTISKSLKINY